MEDFNNYDQDSAMEEEYERIEPDWDVEMEMEEGKNYNISYYSIHNNFYSSTHYKNYQRKFLYYFIFNKVLLFS